MHLIPGFILIAALILAWRWEWTGAALYGAAGLVHIWRVGAMSRPVPSAVREIRILTVAGPATVTAGFWLANWLKRGGLHPFRNRKDA